MQVVQIHPDQSYRDRDGLERWFEGTRAHFAVVDANGRVRAIRPLKFEADIAAAGIRRAAANGVDWNPDP